MAEDEITFEDVDNYKSSTGGSFKEIVLRRYEEALRMSSKELLSYKVYIDSDKKEQTINEISIFKNCINGLYITLKPKIEEKRKHPLLKDILKKLEEETEEYQKWIIKSQKEIENERIIIDNYNKIHINTKLTPNLPKQYSSQKDEKILELTFLKLEVISNILTALDWFDDLTASGG